MSEAIDDRIAMNETKIDYRGYVLWIKSHERKSGGWVPKALIVIPGAEEDGQQELLYPAEGTVATREEADTQAVAMAQRWVDERLAGLRHDRATG